MILSDLNIKRIKINNYVIILLIFKQMALANENKEKRI